MSYSRPSNITDRLKLIGYLLPKINDMQKKSEKCKHADYDSKFVYDKVPDKRKFTWDKLDSYVLVAPSSNLEHLPKNISSKIKSFLKSNRLR